MNESKLFDGSGGPSTRLSSPLIYTSFLAYGSRSSFPLCRHVSFGLGYTIKDWQILLRIVNPPLFRHQIVYNEELVLLRTSGRLPRSASFRQRLRLSPVA